MMPSSQGKAWGLTPISRKGAEGMRRVVLLLTVMAVTLVVVSGVAVAVSIKKGTDGADTLRGTLKADQIRALSGNDTIIGRGGNDTVYGNQGKDTIYGGD